MLWVSDLCDQWSKEQMGNILNRFTGPLNRAEMALVSVDIQSLARPTLWLNIEFCDEIKST